MSQHFLYGGSSNARRIACRGSAVLEQNQADNAKAYTEEGDRDHIVAAQVLRGDSLIDSGDAVEGTVREQVVDVYRAFVDDLRSRFDISEERVEHLYTPGIVGTHDQYGGTVDYGAIYMDDGCLVCHVVDFKAGVGDFVEAAGNIQGLTYLDYMRSEFPNCDVYRFTIVQPQRGDPRTWDYEPSDIEDFRSKMVEVMEGPKDTFEVGDHCRYCKALHNCKAVVEAAHDVEAISKANAIAIGEWGGFATEKDRNDALGHAYLIGSAVRKFYAELNPAILRHFQDGEKFSAIKIVASYGKRKWASCDEITIKKLRARGFGSKRTCIPKLKPLTTIEKEFGEEILKGLVVKSGGGQVIARKSDKRKELTIVSRMPPDDLKLDAAGNAITEITDAELDELI